jgi:hypothetical protein
VPRRSGAKKSCEVSSGFHGEEKREKKINKFMIVALFVTPSAAALCLIRIKDVRD